MGQFFCYTIVSIAAKKKCLTRVDKIVGMLADLMGGGGGFTGAPGKCHVAQSNA
jgi:hypothetical protein